MKYLMTVLFSLLFFTQSVMAAMPPTNIKNRFSTTKSGFTTIEAPNNSYVKTASATGYIDTGNKNFLSDASYESNGTVASTVSISGTGASAVRDTADFIDGKQSINVTLSSTPAQIFLTHVLAPPNSGVTYVNQNWEYSAWVKTTVTGIQLCAYFSAVQKACSDNISASGTWTKVTVNFPGPAGSESYFGYALKTTATSTGTVRVDDAYVGPARNIGSVTQMSLYGSIKYAGAVSCQWSTSSTSYANFAADTDCNTPTASGNMSAPATKIPGGVFANGLPQGEYLIIANGNFGKYNTVDQGVYYRFTDGTNTTVGTQLYNGTAFVSAPTISGRLSVPTSLSGPVTIQVQGIGSASALAQIAANGTSSDLEILVYRIPSAGEIAYRSDQVLDTVGQIFYVRQSTCPTGSIAADGTAIPTQYTRLIAAVGANSPDLRGIFIRGAGVSATIGGVVYTATLGTTQGDTMQGHKHNMKFGNTSEASTLGFGTSGAPAAANNLNSGSDGSNSVSVENPRTDGTNGTPRTGAETRPVNIALTACISVGSTVSAPLLIGGVTSNSSGLERVERATVVCGASSSITRQSGSWLSSVANISSGRCSFVIASGIFSDIPTCRLDRYNVGGTSHVTNSLTVDSTTVGSLGCSYSTSGSSTIATCSGPDTFWLTCQGPR